MGDPSAVWREQIYAVWRHVYSKAYEEQGNLDSFYSDPFLRYDMTLGIWEGDSVVGSSSYSFFDLSLKSMQDHSYTRNLLGEKGLAMLRQRGLDRIMTFESFFITPEYRGHKAWLADLITYLGLEFYHGEQARQDLQGAVTVARMSKNMHEVAKDSGFELVCDDLFYNGESAALLVYTRQEQLPPATQECRALLADLKVTRI